MRKSKQIKYGKEAREALLKGIDAVAKAVVTTLGPKGRNIALDKGWGPPSVVHDGASVAREIDLPDPFENMGAQLVKEAANKTNDDAGDGTTTSTLLAQVITQKGMEKIEAGANPMMLKKGIERATDEVVAELNKMAKPVKTKEEIAQIATISSADSDIGNKIADALDKVGHDGLVTVEEGNGLTIEVDYKEGMEFNRGFMSGYFATNDKMEAEIENTYILLTDKRISSVQDLLPILDKFIHIEGSKSLLIIAEEVEGEVLTLLVANRLKGVFNVVAVNAPGVGDARKDNLEDIAILTGGKVASEEIDLKLPTLTVSDLGRCERVWADKDNTRIIGGKGSKELIEERAKRIKSQIASTESDYEKEQLQKRLAKLVGGVAVIKVGATTEVEVKDKIERVKDAVGATKAATEEGIVPGGETALLRARDAITTIESESIDEKAGAMVIYQALEEPIKMLAKNAGDDESYVLSTIKKHFDKKDFGYDALTSDFGSMFEMGIIDPVKVTRSALQNAASVAKIVLTTEGLVTEYIDKTAPAQVIYPGPNV